MILLARIKKGSTVYNMASVKQQPCIIPYIEEYLKRRPYSGGFNVPDEEHIPSKHFHPSSDPLACPRKLFYDRKDEYAVKEEIPPRLQRIFKHGQAVHCMYQHWFEDMKNIKGFPYSLGAETHVVDENLDISGSIDDILMFEEWGPVCVELKTINTHGFNGLTVPLRNHALQLSSYLVLQDYDWGILLYINKDTDELKEFPVRQNDISWIVAKFGRVKDALADNDVNELQRGCLKDDWQYKRCPYHDICYKGYVGHPSLLD